MSTTDNKENNKEIKTEALPAKKVSASETHQLHVVIHPRRRETQSQNQPDRRNLSWGAKYNQQH